MNPYLTFIVGIAIGSIVTALWKREPWRYNGDVDKLQAENRELRECCLDGLPRTAGVAAVPPSPWIDANDKRPEPGQRIVKRWKNGATWAGIYSGTAKDSSFDAWLPLPSYGVRGLDEPSSKGGA